MSEDNAAQGPLPVVPYLKLPEGADPYIEGHKCGACGSIFLGERSICSKCGSRGQLQPTQLSNQGKLYVYSIVHRSFPGIEVPYISAIVDLAAPSAVRTTGFHGSSFARSRETSSSTCSISNYRSCGPSPT